MDTREWWEHYSDGAAGEGHEGIVKLLLGREDLNPDKADGRDQRPFSLAAASGREGVVKLLLGRDDVNPDKPDKYGLASHSWATTHGHEGVVKILLGRTDLNPTTQIGGAKHHS